MFQFSTYIIPLDEIPHNRHTNYEGIVALQIILLHNILIKKELKACVQSFSFFHQVIAFKVGLPTLKKKCVVCFMESRFKMMKNAFHFILKALFVLKIFKFLFMFKFLVMQEKRLDQKDKFNCRIHDFTTWLKSNCNKHVA